MAIGISFHTDVNSLNQRHVLALAKHGFAKTTDTMNWLRENNAVKP